MAAQLWLTRRYSLLATKLPPQPANYQLIGTPVAKPIATINNALTVRPVTIQATVAAPSDK